MLWSRFSFFTGLLLLLFNPRFLQSEVTKISGVAMGCEDPCQPPPPPSFRPMYGTPPPPPSPPSEPVYEAPPPPTEPVYKAPPAPPTEPVYEAPSQPVGPSCEPPPPPLTTGPLYGVPPPPPPPLIPGNCQPSMQNCVNPPPNTDVYQPLDSGSHFPHHCLHHLVLMFLFFLHF